MQRTGAVVGHEVGDIDQRVDRPQPDRGQALLQPFRRRAVLDAAHQPQRKARTQRRVLHRHLHRAGEFALDRLDGGVFELAHVGGGKIARDAVHAGAVLAVRRQVDFEHGIAEPGPFGVALADRRIGRQFHDAVMVLGNLQLGRRTQHAAAFDAADGADAERDVLAGDEGAGRREHADQSRARIRRAANHLHRRAPSPVSTMQTRRRSAFGCCSAEITRAMENGASAFALSSMFSTSSPIMVSLSASFSSGSSVSRCSFSQESVNFMVLPCCLQKPRPDENARTSASCLR